MYLPRLELIANAEVRVMGDVKIHPSAVIAKGTILQAAPNSQIVIGADVCIGIGAIITAFEGSIEIENGAIIGAEVLILGNCQIGRNSCIGSSTTIFNVSVEATTVISSGSLLGDTSRSVMLDNFDRAASSLDKNVSSSNGNSEEKQQTEKVSSDEQESFWFDSEPPSPPEKENSQDDEGASDRVEDTVANSEALNKVEPKNWEAGQIYINQLLVTLFPNGQSFNRHRSKDSK
jgi:carbon dioxide concentrating mechanism protein CcmN